PCPCGYAGDPKRECRCSSQKIQAYRNRISGPLLDRIDIHIEVPPVRYQDLSSLASGEASEVIRARVAVCRARQRERFARAPHTPCNAAMSARDVQAFCRPDDAAAELLKLAMSELNFSARAYDRIVKVARTIADMAGADTIGPSHISEAIQYRSLDRLMWV
ncbi:MAG: ATP-binding protein, partial [Verrucomicrobiota bacterium]|nr:ATP-binding protein [Verrucomicrobiota bacterium]